MCIQITLKLARVAPRKCRLLMLMATLTVVTLRVLLVVVEGGVVADVGEAAWLV
jgi:hypothetical protein